MGYLLTGLVVLALGIAGWTWLMLSYSYAKGERAGYLQKISEKGWVCKTWEGELAMANLPGAMPEVFKFSVRDAEVAKQLSANAGQRVALSYEYHSGIPTSCFGETGYFITKVTAFVDSSNSPMTQPPANASQPVTQAAPPAPVPAATPHKK